MKKRYPFLPKNWLRFSLTAAFTSSLTLNVLAQSAPNIQWDKTFGGGNANGTEISELRSLHLTSDGGYILGGYSNSGIGGDKTQPSNGLYDYWVVKLDASGNKLWDRAFGGSDFEEGWEIQQTTDGGYILGGGSNSGLSGDKSQPSNDGFDYWIVKLDANGNKLWDKAFGGNIADNLFSLQQTSDGGYILGGRSNSPISGDKSQACKGYFDYWIVKLNANGNKIWDKTLGGSGSEELNSLQQTSDGGYILGGFSSSGISGDKSQPNQGSMDYWVVKIDANGNKTWDKTFGGSGLDEINSLKQTSDGGYILGGSSGSGTNGDKSQACLGANDYWIIKLDANGNKTWDKTIGGSNNDYLEQLQQTSDGGYIIGGTSNSGNGNKTQSSKGMDDYWIVKLDANGNQIWDKTIGGGHYDHFKALQQTSDGGYIIGGCSMSSAGGDKSENTKGGKDFWIVKLGFDVTGINETETNFAVSISPNPNQGKFTLQLSNLTAPKAEVTVSDLLGRVVLQQPLTVSNNQLSEELTLPNAKGMYLLQIKVGEQLITRKIVVE